MTTFRMFDHLDHTVSRTSWTFNTFLLLAVLLVRYKQGFLVLNVAMTFVNYSVMYQKIGYVRVEILRSLGGGFEWNVRKIELN